MLYESRIKVDDHKIAIYDAYLTSSHNDSDQLLLIGSYSCNGILYSFSVEQLFVQNEFYWKMKLQLCLNCCCINFNTFWLWATKMKIDKNAIIQLPFIIIQQISPSSRTDYRAENTFSITITWTKIVI